ncbi:glycosyltransferase family 4 protein [Flavobacterium psychrophilum]|nr:glycosyltransferase family 4 protein [Flavobacterium psychrophilum]
MINIPPQFKENFVTTPVSDRKYDLIFVGSDNPFNIKAIHWFLENVYPLLPIQIKICIVGRVSNNVSDYKNIEKHIFVEDLSSFYNQSKIAICPMLEGTGIKIKVVEALSYGLPIAGTLKSIDGFVASINNGCLVSNSPHEFSTSIQKLLTDSLYYGKIKNEGISFFNQNFSENIVTKIWEGVLENSSEL